MQELLHEMHTYGRAWEEEQDVLNLPDFDLAVVQFLPAVTANWQGAVGTQQ